MMLRNAYRLVLLTLLALLASGCATSEQPGPGATQAPPEPTAAAAPASATPAPETAEPTDSTASAEPTSEAPEGTPEVIGGERPAEVYVPAGYAQGTPAPLLLLLHGYNGDAAGIEEYLNLRPVADQAGVILAIPEGVKDKEGGRFWNAAPVCCDFYGAGVDDSAYLSQLIEDLQARYSVDPRRIYIAGFSNGGFMAHRMACDHADMVAGIVSMAGMGLIDQAACVPARPVAVLQIHGDADTGVLYEGGGMNDLNYPSARQTVEDWAKRNGCATTPREGPALDLLTEGDLNNPGSTPLEGAETTP
jgi:polyhydroxybutyrate depolymerase